MNKVYVVYELRTQEYVLINDLQLQYQIIKVYDTQNKAFTYFHNELNSQCDIIIKPNGEIIKESAEIEEEWKALCYENENKIWANVYYNENLQYEIGIKEMEVE